MMANARRGDQFFRVCVSTQTTRYQNRSTCTCPSKNRFDKATETTVQVTPRNEKAITRPSTASRRTCTRCCSRKETTAHDQLVELPEPYVHQGSTIRFQETHEPETRDSPASSTSLTPKEIMNTWMPRTERPGERLFKPSDNYVDVSPRDFSLRKYFPELFLTETEKKEMRSRELEDPRPAPQDECKDPKCPQGNCSPREVKDPDWRAVVDRPATRTPCPWGDEDLALAQEREEISDEDLNARPQTVSKRESKWFRWSKREKKKK